MCASLSPHQGVDRVCVSLSLSHLRCLVGHLGDACTYIYIYIYIYMHAHLRRLVGHLGDERGREVGGHRRKVDDPRAALADVPVEEADAEHDVRQLVQLRHLVLRRQRGERLQADAREDLRLG